NLLLSCVAQFSQAWK
ncbi:unnamed protein product, partial [Rotaria magnacalcarata]